MTTFTVTHSDGTRSTRTSKTKAYAYAVEVFATAYGQAAPSFGVLRWSESLAAATKAAEGFRRDAVRHPVNCAEWATARVVPVDQA